MISVCGLYVEYYGTHIRDFFLFVYGTVISSAKCITHKSQGNYIMLLEMSIGFVQG